MPSYTGLTAPRLEILTLLGEYKCLSGKQIWQELQPDKQYTHTLGELAALRRWGFIRSRPFRRETGGTGELAWSLLKKGAEAAGIADYDSRYRRRPDRFVIAYRGLELELARQVRACRGWHLVRPDHFNSSHPLPAITPQGDIILQALEQAESNIIEETAWRDPFHPALYQKRLDHLAGDYQSRVPYQANDHLACRLTQPNRVSIIKNVENTLDNSLNGESVEAGVIFILCPTRLNHQFWKSRIELYSRLTRSRFDEITATLPVYAVFEGHAVDKHL